MLFSSLVARWLSTPSFAFKNAFLVPEQVGKLVPCPAASTLSLPVKSVVLFTSYYYIMYLMSSPANVYKVRIGSCRLRKLLAKELNVELSRKFFNYPVSLAGRLVCRRDSAKLTCLSIIVGISNKLHNIADDAGLRIRTFQIVEVERWPQHRVNEFFNSVPERANQL